MRVQRCDRLLRFLEAVIVRSRVVLRSADSWSVLLGSLAVLLLRRWLSIWRCRFLRWPLDLAFQLASRLRHVLALGFRWQVVGLTVGG